VSVLAGELDVAAERYLDEIVSRLRQALGDTLLGVWLIGSGARDDYLPGRSDLDVVAAVSRRLAQHEKEAVVAHCRHDAVACPATGLELVVYEPGSAPAYELNLNGGRFVPFHVSYVAFEDEPWWFVLDLASAHDASRCLFGAPLDDVLPEPDPRAVREALLAMLDWQESTEPSAPNSVLNACRAWHLAERGIWASKTRAAAWAREADPDLVDEALRLRAGETVHGLDPERVRRLVSRAREALQ
jgi:hypothetical protein